MMGNEQLKRYLLGSLAEAEERALNLRIITEPGLEEEFLLAEDELLDDYADGLLSPADAELFRRNFLVSDERRAALRQLESLKRYALRESAERDAAKPGGWFNFPKGGFLLNLRPATMVFALIFVCLLLGVGWEMFFRNAGDERLAEARSEAARLNGEDLSDLSRYAGTFQVALAAGTYRAAESSAALPAERFKSQVLLRLALPPASESGAKFFSARLVGRRGEILALEKIRSYENAGGRELRLLLPASAIEPGDYRVEIADENASAGAPVAYSFIVR